MREHPIPQDIVGYRFHIVGNMTIKQFAELAAGCFVAFLFYATNLVAIIKWPMIGLSIGLGALVAFVPFEERPLDHWVITFIKVLYKPTKFYWKRQAKIPDPFLFEPDPSKKKNEYEVDLTPARRQRIKEYLQSVNNQPADTYEQWRQNRITGIMATFDQVRPQQVQATKQLAKPRLKVRVRSLGKGTVPQHQNTEDVSITQYDTLAEDYSQRQAIDMRTPLPIDQVAQDISIPEQENINVSDQGTISAEDQAVDATTNQAQADRVYQEQIEVEPQDQTIAQSATFNQDLPFPSPPSEPNKIVGMVLTPQNDLVNDAIIEIINDQGRTIRAVKTNALGQFFITTPLPNGTYTIDTEKENLQFSQLSFTLDGSIVNPIEIRSVV